VEDKSAYEKTNESEEGGKAKKKGFFGRFNEEKLKPFFIYKYS
jgi:hypothetical protein